MNQKKLSDTIFPKDKVEIVRYHFLKEQGEPHSHDFAEIAWVEKGKGIHVINNMQLNIQEGDLFLIRPEDEHYYLSKDKDGFVLLNLAIPNSTYQFFLDRYWEEVQDLWTQKNTLPFNIRLNNDELSKLTFHIDQLSSHKSKQSSIDRFLLELINMLSHYSKTNVSLAPLWLLRACEQIRSPIYFQDGIKTFYKLCGKSPGHISRVTISLWEKTPTEIVNKARLEYAAMKLALSSDDIIDISIDCGFLSLPYFYKVFKQYYGMTPRQYKLNRQSLVINYVEPEL